MPRGKLLSTSEAAERLGVSSSRVRRLVADGRLPAVRVGKTWVIREGDLRFVADRRPGWPKGRPRKRRKRRR